jgi:hypothetical protein
MIDIPIYRIDWFKLVPDREERYIRGGEIDKIRKSN